VTKLYIYRNPNRPVSSEYHTEGGIVIITDDSPREAWETYCAVNGLPKIGDAAEGVTMEPLSELGKIVRDSDGNYIGQVLDDPEEIELAESRPEQVIVFPNAGCC
jgi:hypothetical protein